MAGCLYYITINGVETPMTEEELKAYLEKGGLENLMQSGDIDLSKIKTKEDAVQKPSAKKVLQPTPSGTREARGGRTRVEPSEQGQETTFQAEGDEKIQSPRERKKSILNTLLGANLSEKTKMLIEENGTYFQANMEQAEIAAKSILEEIGLENAIIAAKTNEVHPSIGSAIYAEAINSLWSQERQLRSEGETNKADDMALRQAELISDYSDISTSSGQWIAQIKRFYKTSPLGVVRKINTERKKAFDERFAKDKGSFNSLYQQIIKGEEVQSYIKKKAEEIIKEDRKEGRKNKRDSVFKKIDDTAKLWIQKLTSKSAQGAEKMGVGIEDVINKAADAMKKAYIAGESITAIVEDAIEYISDKLGTNEWDIDGFRKDWTDKFSEEAEKKQNKYVNALDKRRKELERRLRENDFSAEKYKEKRTLSEKEADAKDELEEVQKLYDESKKISPEYINKKSKQYLDNFKQRLKSLNDTQKEEIIKMSVRKLIQNGALEYEEFREIIAESIGLSELSAEDTQNIESLMAKINATKDLEDEMLKNRTSENIAKYDKAVDEASLASTEMYNIISKNSDLTSTIRSLITGSLLSIPTLIKNPVYNIVFQSQLRFPKALVKNILEQSIYGASLMMNKYISSKSPIYMPTSNILLGWRGYFKQGKLGGKRGLKNFMLGVTQPDFNSTSAYQSTLSPRQAIKDLELYRAGQKLLTKSEVIDRIIRKSWPARQADFILRAMGLGDLPQRYAAEGAVAMQIAVKELKLIEDNDIIAFMRSPQKMAYKILTEQKNPDAASLSEEMYNRIIAEGERAVFQEANVLSKISEFIDKSLKVNKDSEYKAAKISAALIKTASFPFIKIPANVAWATFKAANPAFSIGQSAIQGIKARLYYKRGEYAKSREYQEKGKDALSHAIVGYGLGLVAAQLVAAGLVRPANDKETKERESVGEAVFGRQNQLNVGALSGNEDFWVDLTWFGPIGAILEAKAEVAQDKKQMEREGKEQSEVMDIIDEMTYSAKAAMNQLVFDQGARIMDAIQKGGPAAKQYFINNVVNNFTNIITGATSVAASKAMLPYKAQLAGETLWQEIVNNQQQRNILLRVAMNLYKEDSGYPPAKISIFDGEPIKNDNSVLGTTGSMMGMEKGNSDKFGAIIFNDFQRTGDLDFFPPSIPRELTVNEERIKLTPSERKDLTIAIGKANYNNISPFVHDMAMLKEYNKRYTQLTDEDKVKVLKFLYSEASDDGLEQFIKDNPKFQDAEIDEKKNIEEFEKEKPQLYFEIGTIKDKFKAQKQP
jgi:hypothetical protein